MGSSEREISRLSLTFVKSYAILCLVHLLFSLVVETSGSEDPQTARL